MNYGKNVVTKRVIDEKLRKLSNLTLSSPIPLRLCTLSYWSSPTTFNFWHSGALALSPERQSARMSKIKSGGFDQYGAEPFKQQQFVTAGVERVKLHKWESPCCAVLLALCGWTARDDTELTTERRMEMDRIMRRMKRVKETARREVYAWFSACSLGPSVEPVLSSVRCHPSVSARSHDRQTPARRLPNWPRLPAWVVTTSL